MYFEVFELFLEQEVEEFTHRDVHEDSAADIVTEGRRSLADLVDVRVDLQLECSLVTLWQRLRETDDSADEERGHIGWANCGRELLLEHADLFLLNFLQLLSS